MSGAAIKRETEVGLDVDLLEFDALAVSPANIQDADRDSVGSMGAGGFDTKRSISSDLMSDSEDFYNDLNIEALGLGLDLGNEENTALQKTDDIFQQIKDTISQRQNASRAGSSIRSGSFTDSPQIKTSEDYQSVPYGIQPRATYEHGKRSTEIMGVTYNGRMRQFIIIDSKGVTAWKRDAVDHRVSRVLYYPKYEYGLITHMVYAKKYNCYFALGKDFSLKVYNRDFFETCSVSADLRSVLFMLFNPKRDELITGGVGGTKVWRFHQQAGRSFTELKPLANYGLTLKYELPNVGGSWVKRVELDHHLEHLYCCSDTDLYVYDLAGKLLFKFERAHMMSITGCRYSLNAGVLVTSSIDCEVKVWSLMGGLVHTFRGHSRAVTNLILHPTTSSIVITCSLDGTVRMWSLDTMDTLYNLVVSADGVHWMGLTDDNLLFLSTPRAITLWNLNYSHQFWALARSNVTTMSLVGCKTKTTRVMAISDDSSVRLMARSNKKNLCTVLPPPSISPLQRVLSVCYSREFNVIFMLINPHEIWVYTTRTDPSCRIAVWDVIEMQASFSSHRSSAGIGENFNPSSTISVNKPAPSHRATENGAGNESLVNCCCVSILNSTAILWTDEGCCCPIRDSYLLLGLEDGRILFMDPVVKGHKYLEFKTGKDPVLDMTHDATDNSLSTVHKLKDRMLIQVWSLPDLELQHEVYVAPDLRSYARVGYVMACGHESGCVIFNNLEIATDPGLNKGKMIPPYHEVIDSSHKPEHFEPVLGVDVCPALKIFCSCSKDGAIKIWNEDGKLMTEIMLDESLTSICFLNNMGDIIVGFQKHIFIIDHVRVCPQLTVPDSDVDSFDKESFICEDPAVLYEGVTPNPDPVTLESYLVPFDIEFSKDFLEGRVKLEPEIVKEEESDEESDVSMAPTEIYHSPVTTPKRRLSRIDLLLGTEVSPHDLLKQMKKTLEHLAEKERLENDEMLLQEKIAAERRYCAERRKRRRMMKKGLSDSPDGTAAQLENEEAKGELSETEDMSDKLTFEFPKFGESPGPTPVSTAPPTPDILSEEEEETELMEEPVQAPEVKVVIDILPRGQDDIAKFLEAEQKKEVSKGKEKEKVSVPTPRKKFGLSGVTIDAESLMKTKSPRPVRQESITPKPQTVKPSEVSLQISQPKTPRKERAMKKRMSISNRRPSRLKKSDFPDENERPGSPPSSQMETLKLSQDDYDTPEPDRTKFQMPVVDLRRQSLDLQDDGKEALFEDKLGQKEKKFQRQEEKSAKEVKADREVKAAKAEVPELPTIPSKPDSVEEKKTNIHPTADAPVKANFQAQGEAKRMAMDFSRMTMTPSRLSPSTSVSISQSVEQEMSDMPDGKKEPSTTNMTLASVDGMSLVSGESEDGQTTFRLGLLSKEPVNMDQESLPPSTFSPLLPVDVDSKPTSKPLPQTNKENFKKECSLDNNVGPKVANKKKSTKPNIKSTSKGKKIPVSTKETVKTETRKDKPESDSENNLNSLADKQRLKETKSNPEIKKFPPDPESLFDALKKVETEKTLDSKVQLSSSPSVEPGSIISVPSAQTHTSGLLGSYAIRDTFDHHLPSIPESETPLDESDVRLPSPDSSIRRPTTPSVSVIENESNYSTSPAPSLSRGVFSPLPVLSEYPLHSSPLPPLDEVPGHDWLSEEAASDNVPFQSNESSQLDKKKQKKLPSLVESSITLSSHSVISSQSALEHNADSSLTSTVISSQIDSGRVALKGKSDKQKEITTDSALKMNSDKNQKVSHANNNNDIKMSMSLKEKHPQSPSTEFDLNENIDPSMTMTNQSVATMKEYPDDTTLFSNLHENHNSPVSHVDISFKTGDFPAVEITEQSMPAGEIRDDGSGLGFDPNEALAGIETDLSGEDWDTDSNAFSPSDDSYMMTSSLSDTESRHSQQTDDKTHNGHASSSSNTEPLLQVKIRRKPWSHYRNKQLAKQQSTDPSARKLSHSDAMTVQRKAYLETLRLRKKRAKSAVEANSIFPSPRNQLTQQQLQKRQQRPSPEMTQSQTFSQCVFCAAEGEHSHTSHKSEEENVRRDSQRVSVIESPRTPRAKFSLASAVFDKEAALAPATPHSKTHGLDSVTMSDSQVSPVDKSPTPCDTPDPFNSHTASRAMSALSESPVNLFTTTSPDSSKQRLANEQVKKTRITPRSERSVTTHRSHLGEKIQAPFCSEEERLHDTGVMRVEMNVEERASGRKLDSVTREEGDLLDKIGPQDLAPESTSSRSRERPKTSLDTASLGKPELDEAVKYFRQRPHTAQVKFQTQDLQEAFDNSLTRYQQLARTPMASDNIHRNGDMAFSENWHQRQIERWRQTYNSMWPRKKPSKLALSICNRTYKHMLLRMQKELRAQSARQKRQVMEQRTLVRQKELLSGCPSPGHGQFSSRALPVHQQPAHRSNTVHGSRPIIPIPAPTPVSSRPHTATGLHTGPPIHHQPASFMMCQQDSREKFNRLQEMEMLQKEKLELSHERAFRFRLSQKESDEQVREVQEVIHPENVDLWLIDPRNPCAMRPKSSKSIPSKCHRYVLVSKPKVRLHLPLPSPLEEELLATRFPEQGERVFRKYEGLLYKPPRRPVYGIEYTPFQAPLL